MRNQLLTPVPFISSHLFGLASQLIETSIQYLKDCDLKDCDEWRRKGHFYSGRMTKRLTL